MDYELTTEVGADGDTEGTTATLMIEGGTRIALANGNSVVPWGRVAYSSADVDAFTDSNGTTQDPETVSGATLSLGVLAERELSNGLAGGSVFAGIGLHHRSGFDADSKLLDTEISDDFGTRNGAELITGAKWHSEVADIWVNLAANRSLDDSSDWGLSGGLGIAISF